MINPVWGRTEAPPLVCFHSTCQQLRKTTRSEGNLYFDRRKEALELPVCKALRPKYGVPPPEFLRPDAQDEAAGLLLRKLQPMPP